MKRKLLALLLAMALAFSAALPLGVTALAADKVVIAVQAAGVAHYSQADFDKLPAGVTANVDSGNKTVFLHLNNYNGYSLYVKTPGKKWSVFASVAGSNTLQVYKSYDTGKYHALGANCSLLVYANGGNATLTINGNFSGTYPDADYYALYGDGIAVGGTSSDRLTVNVNFNLVTSQYTNKTVYPVNEDLTVNSANFHYSYASGVEYPHAETGITLTGSAYFYLSYNAKGAKDRSARALWGIEYDKDFTGVAYMQVVNGYHYGGAYSYEKYGCELAPRYYTYIGDTEYYHVKAKNCQFAQNPVDTVILGNNLKFSVEAGSTFPDHISATGFDASVVWEDENGNDVTGKQAEYGIEYTAYVSLVPWGTNRIEPITVDYLDTFMKPAPKNRFSFGVDHSSNKIFADGILLRYKIPVPDTVITKQPVNFDGSATNQNARFEVETSGPVTAYQWQTSENGKDGWTNVEDLTVYGSTPITGAKTKSLNYNFASVAPSVTLRWFRCEITGQKNGVETKLYTNVVKYENASKISVVKISSNALPVHGQPVPTTASSATPHVKVTKYACTMFGKKLDYYEAGDNVKISVQLEAVDGYVFDDEITGVLEGATVGFCKVYDGNKTAIVDFSYRVGAPEGGIPYKEIKYYVDKPVTGERPSDIVFTYDPDSPPSTGGGAKQKFQREAPPVVSVEWYPADNPFEGHKEYNLQFVVKSIDYENDGYTGYPYCFKKDVTKAYVNGEEAAITPSEDGKTATITFRFPLTADAIEIPAIEFTKLDYPNGETALDTVAESGTPGVTVDSVRYEKDGATVTEAAPGDELKVIFSFTLAEGYLLAADATATWNGLECYAEYTGGAQKFLPVGAHSYLVAFRYAIPEKSEEPVKYTVTVTDGTADPAQAAEGETVTVAAAPAPEGKLFDRWTVVSGNVGKADLTKALLVFAMPAEDVSLAATYQDPADPADLTKYTVTVTDGTADPAEAPKGAAVTVTAGAAPEGKEFDKWVVESGDLGGADLTNATLFFLMPAGNVALKATYQDKAADPGAVMLGDVDGNGVIESADARLCLRRSVSLETYPEGSREYIACDVDKTDGVTSGDARLILRASVHLEDPTAW